ncbi:MAG TPA: nuclear transport factor 2 family protein [Usitatibacter sp.]|nr:nuclear transport factor 2 family protein [Usitatibacter sp.]
MPTAERLKAYVAMVNEGRYADAIREFYHEDAAMHENQKPPRVGRDALVANEERAMQRVAIRTVKLEAFPAGDLVAVHSVFEFVDKEGRVSGLDEMSIQRWKGDRIAEEHFFYDPAQLRKPGEAAPG